MEFKRSNITNPAQVGMARLGSFLEGVKGKPIGREEFIAFLIVVERDVDNPDLQNTIDEIYKFMQTEDLTFNRDNPTIDWWEIAEQFYDETSFTREK